MDQALYGPGGFYRAEAGPAAHFRTSVHASPLFATAVVRLLRETDEALGRPRELTLMDVGAGRGELLEAVAAQLADDPLGERLRLVAIEVADRPDGVAPTITWRDSLPVNDRGERITGLLVANEWLDNVPCDVAEATPEGWRIVEVAADGTERLGPAPNAAQEAWLTAWWPRPEAAHAEDAEAADDPSDGLGPARAEIGLARDAAWQRAVSVLERGVAIAIDYAHTRASRPRYGTSTGYAHGRQIIPVPDGSCDITAHVALDACAAAAQADWTVHSSQRKVFHSLGITGGRPDLALASSDPRGYLRALSQASAAAELTDPAGLGGFGWLVQGVGVPLPALLSHT
jgi:SAM-dependent MidA family methyltransferase